MNKDTEQLENEIKQINDPIEIENFIVNNQSEFTNLNLQSYLKKMLDEKNLIKAQVIADSKLEQIYAYHIFAGRKKHPSREKIISLALAMHLNLDETQHLLYYAGCEKLYAKNSWDSVVIFAVENNLSVYETNDLLNKLAEIANLGDLGDYDE